MLKKILLWILLFFTLWILNTFSSCSYNGESNLTSDLVEWCLDPEWSHLVQWKMKVWWEFKDKIENWIDTIRNVLWLLAVSSLVYGSFIMVISIWEEEKTKKWKDIVKWWIIWFIGIIWAGTIIKVIIWVLIE